MSTTTLPTELPTVEGAPLALVTTTAYYRADSWSQFHRLAELNAHARGYVFTYDQDTGQPSHVSWDDVTPGLRLCIWAPDEVAA